MTLKSIRRRERQNVTAVNFAGSDAFKSRNVLAWVLLLLTFAALSPNRRYVGWLCRSAHRYGVVPGDRDCFVGFRASLVLKEA